MKYTSPPPEPQAKNHSLPVFVLVAVDTTSSMLVTRPDPVLQEGFWVAGGHEHPDDVIAPQEAADRAGRMVEVFGGAVRHAIGDFCKETKFPRGQVASNVWVSPKGPDNAPFIVWQVLVSDPEKSTVAMPEAWLRDLARSVWSPILEKAGLPHVMLDRATAMLMGNRYAYTQAMLAHVLSDHSPLADPVLKARMQDFLPINEAPKGKKPRL
jgi:hypothetical protein